MAQIPVLNATRWLAVVSATPPQCASPASQATIKLPPILALNAQMSCVSHALTSPTASTAFPATSLTAAETANNAVPSSRAVYFVTQLNASNANQDTIFPLPTSVLVVRLMAAKSAILNCQPNA
jgi:hypothetical protein